LARKKTRGPPMEAEKRGGRNVREENRTGL
jgi:hypothetical protein